MTLQAYRKMQHAGEDPRNTEYRLFGQITGAMIDASRMKGGTGALAEVLDRNRRLWSFLAIDCADERNGLSKELRASIISLSIWVAKYSRQVIREGAPLEPLIDVNRNMMQGLQSAA